MTALREPVHAEQTQPSWRPVCRWVGVAEVTIALQGLRIAPVVLPESGQQRVARVYPGSKYRAATSVITLRPPTEGGGSGGSAAGPCVVGALRRSAERRRACTGRGRLIQGLPSGQFNGGG